MAEHFNVRVANMCDDPLVLQSSVSGADAAALCGFLQLPATTGSAQGKVPM